MGLKTGQRWVRAPQRRESKALLGLRPSPQEEEALRGVEAQE